MKRNKAIIYQIGRLDANALNLLGFEIEGKVYQTSLSSFAIRDYLAKDNVETEVVLLYPVSLPFNSVLFNNDRFRKICSEEFYRLLESSYSFPDEYIKKPEILFREHPHSKEASDFKVIHSLGKYRTSKGQISFEECYYSDIVLIILKDMVERYIEKGEEVERIIVDISSGHNIYLNALLEALKYLNTFIYISNWNLQNPSTEIAFSEPINPSSATEIYKIFFEKQTTRIFFSSPITLEDIQNFKLARAIYSSDRDSKRKLQEFFEIFCIVFSAIKNNIPLATYTFDYKDVGGVISELKKLLDAIGNELAKNYKSSPGFDKNIYIKAILALGFSLGISKILRTFKIKFIDENGVCLDEIQSSFDNIYRIFMLDLNKVVLGNEIDQLKKKAKPSEDWMSLIQCIDITDFKVISPQKRNFFAHAGLEYNTTECRIEEDKIFVRYVKEHQETIKKWLKQSI